VLCDKHAVVAEFVSADAVERHQDQISGDLPTAPEMDNWSAGLAAK
jgi:hypothetical protein